MRQGIHNAAQRYYTHPQYIAIFSDGRAFVSRCDLLHPYYDPEATRTMFWLRDLEHNEAIISHLERAIPFLGFTPWASTSTRLWSWPSCNPRAKILRAVFAQSLQGTPVAVASRHG